MEGRAMTLPWGAEAAMLWGSFLGIRREEQATEGPVFSVRAFGVQFSFYE